MPEYPSEDRRRASGSEWTYRLGRIEHTVTELERRVRGIEDARLREAASVALIVENDRRLDELEDDVEGIQKERAALVLEGERTEHRADRRFTRRERLAAGTVAGAMLLLQLLNTLHGLVS